MSSNTFTVKTAVQSAQPRSKRLRGLAGDVIVGSGSAGSVAGSVGEGHSHANKSLLDSLLSDEDGYLYIVGKTEVSDDSIAAKILAGSADKWAGHAWEGYMDQSLRSSDDVAFTSVTVDKVVFTNGAVLEVDRDYIKINKVLYSTKNLAVLGDGEDVPSGGGGGSSYNRLDAWEDYDSGKAGYVLSALLGNELNIRVSALELSLHTHSNKSVLDTITSAMVNKWNKDYLPATTKYALSDEVGGDALQAKKLTYQRIINLSGAVQSNGAYFDGATNISIPVNYIYDDYIQSNWTPKNNNELNFLTRLWLDEFRGNQFAFMDPDAVTVQYSRDGGSTWINYYPRTTADEIYLDNLLKKRFLSGINTNLSNFYTLGKATTPSEASNLNQLRIEIDMTKAKLDCNIDFLVAYINRHGDHNLYVTIDKRHTTTGSWTTLVNKVQLTGGPAYNKINIPNGGLRTDLYGQGDGVTNSWNTRFIRLTFTQTLGTTQSFGCFIYNLYSIGRTYTSQTYLGTRGTLYDYDEYQNMKLPAGVILNTGIVFSNGCSIVVDGDKLKVHGTIYSDSNVAVKTE